MEAADPAGAVFAALADPTRRRVVRILAEEGTATATDLAARLSVTRQAVAKHFAALSVAGLVTAHRQGRETRYQLTPAPLTEAMGWIAQIGAEWDTRLAALKAMLSDGSETTPSPGPPSPSLRAAARERGA